MVISCVGCGANILNAKGKQTLCSEATQHVQPLWCRLLMKSYGVKEEMNKPIVYYL